MNDPTTFQKGEKELVFVYNARSDIFSKVIDFAHKIISPATYSCSLCSLTHGSLGMHQEWAEFIQNLPYQISFLYKDQVEAPSGMDLPQVWLLEGPSKKVLINAHQLKSLSSLKALMTLIRTRLEEEGEAG